MTFNSVLPLDESWNEIETALKKHRHLVLVAEPGAGKTTRFPPLLLQSGLLDPRKKILMLEPRRLAARAAAARIAFEQGWTLGKEVGYQVRFESRITTDTRLQVLTEGLLARRLQSDPEISDVGCVILDEFHERSQHTDLALGLLKELYDLSRPDLRLIVMSATLDAEKVAAYLEDAAIVKVPGRQHPVEVSYAKYPLRLETGPDFLDEVSRTINEAVSRTSQAALRDLLVFLPGAREIRGVRERLQRSGIENHGAQVVELHGSLALEEQDRAIRPISGKRKIVLATNIAETSLTIDGVGFVIDTGLARVMRQDSLGFERLELSRISAASAAQRAGRAGRQGPGRCHRMWSRIDEASFPKFETAEIMRANLSEAILALMSQGVTDSSSFSWFEKPSAENLSWAERSLVDLGIRDARSGALTAFGQEAIRLPLPPRLAKLLLESVKVGDGELGATIAALLSERDIVTRPHDLKREARRDLSSESDLLLRLDLLEDARAHEVDPIARRNVLRVRDQLLSLTRRLDSSTLGPSKLDRNDPDMALKLLLLAFPDRLARRRRNKDTSVRIVGGKGARLAPFSVVETSELLVALATSEPPVNFGQSGSSTRDPWISLASRVDRNWIEELFPEAIGKSVEIAFDETTRSVQKRTALGFHDLALEEPSISRPSTEEAFATLVKTANDRWTLDFETHELLSPLLARLKFLDSTLSAKPEAEAEPESRSESESATESTVETNSNRVAGFSLDRETKAAFLEESCFGETKLQDVLSKSLDEILLRHLPKETERLLREEAPSHVIVPTGTRIRIEYPEGRAPYCEVRIQEVFGWTKSPRVARGRVPIVMHLLGPNFRPVQVTADLESFWTSGYAEVRKELRSRYPKHSWPEDPWTAKAEAKGRHRPR